MKIEREKYKLNQQLKIYLKRKSMLVILKVCNKLMWIVASFPQWGPGSIPGAVM
jgi:hypothetical protein